MAEFAYIGRCKCGNILAGQVDDPDRPYDVADAVHEMITTGFVVERVALPVQFSRCTCSAMETVALEK